MQGKTRCRERVSMSKRKRTKRSNYSQVEFGYDDGRADTVMLMLPSASVTLEGKMLDRVTAAYFSLYGYTVTPSPRSLDLIKKTPWPGHVVAHDKYRRGGERTKGPLHFTMSLTGSGRKDVDPRRSRLRLWIQSTVHPHFFININFSRQDAKAFGQRLAEAAGWEIE